MKNKGKVGSLDSLSHTVYDDDDDDDDEIIISISALVGVKTE